MAEADDFELLTDYANRGSESAFTILTKRYIHLVYSAALRQVHNPHLAEEVTQAVFIILVKKAHTFRHGVILSGWLLRATRFTASNLLTSQSRRLQREQQAAHMEPAASESAWEQIAPFLDAAMAQLGDKDRDALALRFFDQKPLKEVGLILGIDEDTARKRVSRAVDKLRQIFLKRGVTLSALTIMGVLATNAVQAAPAAIVGSVAAAGFLNATVSSSALIKTTVKMMAWANFKCLVLTASLSLLLTITVTATVAAFQLFGQTSAATIPGGRLRLPIGTNTPAIAMGSAHGVILASDGSLWTWGQNLRGWPVLGLGEINTQRFLRRIGNENDWVDVASSPTHVMAVKSDGTLWGWGANSEYELGDGTDSPRKQPVPSEPGNDWKQVAAGGTHTLALTRSGTLWAWGNNWAGQLGIGTRKLSPEAVQVGSNSNWVKVWSQGIQTVGLQSDGSLWFWGSLTGGAKDTHRFFVPTRVSPDTNWVDACFGYFCVLAIKADGTLWAWGRNAGIYTDAPIELVNPSPVRVGNESDWKACASTEYFYHLLTKKDGSLWALDASDHSKGLKTPKPAEFRKINLRKEIVAFGTTGRDGMGAALTRDGEVWTWGAVLGEYKPVRPNAKDIVYEPVLRKEPWLLPNIPPSQPSLQ
ncbi:MAG: regulator of chromosome condensation [Verrucomicrobiales bacterium]|nr:regulator of chromosome condensation [Verrucomicrobiales bacterium]